MFSFALSLRSGSTVRPLSAMETFNGSSDFLVRLRSSSSSSSCCPLGCPAWDCSSNRHCSSYGSSLTSATPLTSGRGPSSSISSYIAVYMLARGCHMPPLIGISQNTERPTHPSGVPADHSFFTPASWPAASLYGSFPTAGPTPESAPQSMLTHTVPVARLTFSS